MNLRDVKPSTLRHIAAECDDEFEAWLKATEGKVSQTVNGMTARVPAASLDIWRTAFSLGVSAALRRIDKLREE